MDIKLECQENELGCQSLDANCLAQKGTNTMPEENTLNLSVQQIPLIQVQ